jgi:hypothetical protein
MSKIELNYLVFDDDIDAPKQYKDKIKIPGCLVNSICINPVDFFNVDENNFNEEGFKNEIINKTKGRNINLVITDWNIMKAHEGFDGIIGWNIIEKVLEAKEKLKSRTFLIYSSDTKKASSYVLNKIKKEVEDNPEDTIPSLDFISKLLNLQIKFCNRDRQRFEEIKTLLKSSNTISNVVLDSIISFDENMIINTGNADFDGKKISNILSDNNNIDLGGLKFIRELIELSISHYSNLNE